MKEVEEHGNSETRGRGGKPSSVEAINSTANPDMSIQLLPIHDEQSLGVGEA